MPTGIFAPFDTDGGATFRRACAVRGIDGKYLMAEGIVSKPTVRRLKTGQPVTNAVRRRVVALFKAVPPDPDLVFGPDEAVGS